MHKTPRVKEQADALDWSTGKGEGTVDLFHGAVPPESTLQFRPLLIRTPLKSWEFSSNNCYQRLAQTSQLGLTRGLI